jgi:hypothetical protein
MGEKQQLSFTGITTVSRGQVSHCASRATRALAGRPRRFGKDGDYGTNADVIASFFGQRA